MSYKKGFTLIELLVVISIISLLSSVVLASLKTARIKANDARRILDLKQVALALELYSNQFNTYPPMASSLRQNSCFDGPNPANSMPAGQWGTTLGTLVTNNFISALPNDPKNNSVYGNHGMSCYQYYRNINDAGYYHACRNVETGQPEFLKDYEYIIYYSPEQRPVTKGYIQWWGADANANNDNAADRPYLGCFFGPRRN